MPFHNFGNLEIKCIVALVSANEFGIIKGGHGQIRKYTTISWKTSYIPVISSGNERNVRSIVFHDILVNAAGKVTGIM